jgi:hypothetical protein
MKNEKRLAILAKIKSSIDHHGFHVHYVSGGPLPRFAYTIGLYPTLGFELVFAGGCFFELKEVHNIITQIVHRLQPGEIPSSFFDLDRIGGSFSCLEIDESWGSMMLLGALDYYDLKRMKAFQIIPDQEHWTIDIPNMREPWDPLIHPIWQWLETSWPYSVSCKSTVGTNLDALRGTQVNEVTRWEGDVWEMFAGVGPDVEKADFRVVPLGVMLAHDETLKPALDLEIEHGMWRDDGGEWHPWGKAK